MKFLKQVLPVFLVAAAVVVLFPFFSGASDAGRPSLKREFDNFLYVTSLIEASYVDSVTPSRLLKGALSGMLGTLDPYSQYLDSEAYQDLQSDTKGRFGGIGLEVSVKGGTLHVITPLDGSPADKAGLRAGDVILKIDGIATKNKPLAEAVRQMRGKPGETVVLSVMHEGEKEIIDVPVKREIVKVLGIREAKLLEGGAGYIRVSEFQEQTPKDFKKALEELQEQGMKGLVIDVRNNPGGLMSSAVEVAENFIEDGRLIVETKGRLVRKNVRHFSSNKHPLLVRPLVVLVNKGSASGSEILAGALQDHRLATVLGTKTYGKGCVQTLTPLPDGTAVRITTSRYYAPSGRLIHEVGLEPDVAVPDVAKDGKDIQLERALELVRKTPDA